jgi:hypothetical protein
MRCPLRFTLTAAASLVNPFEVPLPMLGDETARIGVLPTTRAAHF